MLDLTIAVNRKTIANVIKADIDAYCVTAYGDGHRKHLGASQIGHPCSRYLFNVFRWVKYTKHSGRMQRLFNRGHREEARFIEWLRGIGFEVIDLTPEGKQQRITAVMGHFGGSLDGQASPPIKYNINERLLLEFKTQGTGSGFEKLKSEGVQKAKPQHYAQMCNYGKHYKIRYALYCCINKNDDDLHIEIVALDWQLAEQLEAKAEDIIKATVPPEKFAYSEAVFECKYCDFMGLCHRGEQAEKNCRSCINSVAVDNGQWYCRLYNNIIPEDFIAKGCEQWVPIV
jgi:hypothetical protein